MQRRWMLAAILLAGAQAASAADPGAAQTAQVFIDNFSFAPAVLTVTPGTTVTWTNRDDIPHTVLAGGPQGLIKSGPMDTDDSFSFTFDKPGRYDYFCTLHPHMQGSVVVQ